MCRFYHFHYAGSDTDNPFVQACVILLTKSPVFRWAQTVKSREYKGNTYTYTDRPTDRQTDRDREHLTLKLTKPFRLSVYHSCCVSWQRRWLLAVRVNEDITVQETRPEDFPRPQRGRGRVRGLNTTSQRPQSPHPLRQQARKEARGGGGIQTLIYTT